MSTLFEKFGTRYTNYMVRQGRNQARRVLLSQSDLILKDLGLSRELLESGINGWPWKAVAEQPAPLVVTPQYSRREENRAIRELRALSNRELQDIGITRGDIIEAVKNGRPAHTERAQPAINLTVLAKHAVGTASVDLDDTAANTPLPKIEAA